MHMKRLTCSNTTIKKQQTDNNKMSTHSIHKVLLETPTV